MGLYKLNSVSSIVTLLMSGEQIRLWYLCMALLTGPEQVITWVLLLLFCCFTSTVNIEGHVGTIS